MRNPGLKKTLAVALAGLAVAGGGVAVAASGGDSSSSFFDAVARHLGISPERLEEATKAAALEQVDAALEGGRITETQADELRSRIESGEAVGMLGHGLGGFMGPGGPRGHNGPGFGGDLTATAAYLGLTAGELRERLRDGESVAGIAEAEGKSVDGQKQTMLDATRQRLDEAVESGRLSREQADAFLERIEERIGDVVEGALPRAHRGSPPFWAPRAPGSEDGSGTSSRPAAPAAGAL